MEFASQTEMIYNNTYSPNVGWKKITQRTSYDS